MKRLIFILLIFGLSFSQYGAIINSSLSPSNVSASASKKVYVDSFGDNPDFALLLCDASQKYVGAVYSATVASNTLYMLVSSNLSAGSPDSLVYTSNTYNSTCYYTPLSDFAFLQFRQFTKTPRGYVSAFPGRPHIIYSDQPTATSPSFVFLNFSDGWLRGNYSITSSFSESTGNVNVDINSIEFSTDIGDISRSPSDPDWGLSASTGRSILLALCSDTTGDSCSDAIQVNQSSDLPVDLALGQPTNDQTTYNQYIVVNGLAFPICIGSDLSGSVSLSPSTQYYSQNISVDITITNTGNVEVTTDFVVRLTINGPGGYSDVSTWTVTDDLSPGASTHIYKNWTANGLSGSYTFTAEIDQTNQISECSETNNQPSATGTVLPVYILHWERDGEENYTFPEWGRPYNITMWVTDSDGNQVNDAHFVIKEINGLNPFIPLQVWDNSGSPIGIKSISLAEADSNSTGYLSFTAVPTCNLLYTVYSGEHVENYVGNYSIVVNAYTPHTSSTPIMFSHEGILTTDPELHIGNTTCSDPGWINNKQIINKDKYVLWIYDWIYQVYSITKKLVVP